jgi:hypothetical protein
MTWLNLNLVLTLLLILLFGSSGVVAAVLLVGPQGLLIAVGPIPVCLTILCFCLYRVHHRRQG